MPHSLVINYGGGSSLSFDFFSITQDEITYDLNVSRTPYSDNWFSYGTGDELSSVVGIRVPTNLLGDVTKRNILAAQNCTSIVYNGFSRNTFGMTGTYSDQPTAVGYLQTFQVACSAEWSAGAGTAGSTSSNISLTHSGGTLNICSMPPQQNLSFARTVSRGSTALIQSGDEHITPQNFIVEAKAIGSSYQAQWASMVQISNAAKTATAYNFGATTIDLFGLKRLSRRYTSHGIYITMEFLASELY